MIEEFFLGLFLLLICGAILSFVAQKFFKTHDEWNR